MSAPFRPMTTRGFANLKVSPLAGPDVIARTKTPSAGSFRLSSAGESRKFELDESARANEGSGLITTV
jgi:hypothetical protein